ncbi:MAG: zf-HC2 domain-containing protein [Planctomycetes bacterium]|nr:zf-HC2 domain-containing protein [Planctomycetota bacterium]
MNCNTCRYELSQCLDGRLPSGRRAVVLTHAESCEACGQFWDELQAAQRLTLSLRPSEVSSQFREGLWERIHSGEGTPDAVFHTPVAIWTKVRYSLTGAAAAAALLIGLTLLQKDPTSPPTSEEDLAATVTTDYDDGARPTIADPHHAQPRLAATNAGTGLQPRVPMHRAFAENPLLRNAQPLTLQVLAREAANQLEQRYHEAAIGLRMMRDPSNNRAAAVRRVIDNANELRDFGELLIDMRERKRLVFTDNEVDRDLSFAVEWLGRVPALPAHTPDVVDTYFGPALSRRRLANVTDHIGLTLTHDPQREMHELKELNTQRPEIFPKLFFVFGSPEDLQGSLATLAPNVTFVDSACGPSWVAPRSAVVRHDTLMRMFSDQGEMRIEIEVHEGR